MKLTKRQKEIFDFISGFIKREGYSPSMEEIASHFSIASLNAVYKHLEALQTRGYLHRDANRARSIELSQTKGSGVHSLPMLGFIAAGHPIEAIAIPETMGIPGEWVDEPETHYILRVRGDSMIEEHIADGDYIIVQSTETANPGELVVALVDGENVTLKRFFREGARIRLQPANEKLAPLILDAPRVKIQGIIVGVMRKYR